MAASAIRFGALLRQADNRWSSIAESARICDDLGFHSIHFIDHLLALPDPTGDILESWTTLTACAAITRRLRLGGNMLCNGFRSPALLAKMGATLDVISEGRFELGIGAGWHEPEFRAYGFDFPRPSVRIGQLAEAVRIIKRLWAGKRVDFEGCHYRLHGGICRPRPLQHAGRRARARDDARAARTRVSHRPGGDARPGPIGVTGRRALRGARRPVTST